MPLTIYPATQEDAPSLNAAGRRLFAETFGHLYRREDMEAYFAEAYNEAQLREVLKREDTIIYIAANAHERVGYITAGPCGLPVPGKDESGVAEIRRLYVENGYHGQGIGGRLLDRAVEWCRGRGVREIYIGMWEHNHGAQRLYRRHGFLEAGEYLFKVGQQFDREIIMKKRLDTL